MSQSNHDLSIFGDSQFQFVTGEVCIFCHTPHNANPAVHGNTFINANDATAVYQNAEPSVGASLYLWNRALSNAGTADGGGYWTYSSSTSQANTGQVRALSLLCLSCHDGVGALNVMINPPYEIDRGTCVPGENPSDADCNRIVDPGPGVTWTKIGQGNMGGDPIGANIGDRYLWTGQTDSGFVNLRNDHPVSFDYDDTLVNADNPGGGPGGLRMPDNAQGIVQNGAYTLRLFPNPSGQLKSLECSSCHDVHDQGVPYNGSAGSGDYPFLAVSNTNSALCFVCHEK